MLGRCTSACLHTPEDPPLPACCHCPYCSPAIYSHLPQVGILLNNAGAFYEHPDYLETLGSDWIQGHLWINCLAPTMVRARE